MKNRIGLYGGTFDPVHLGHLKVAQSVLELFEIEKVLFVPAQLAPHKLARPVTASLHRYAMLALATQDDPALEISTYEMDGSDRRFTVDTIGHFQLELGDDNELFFIMGADSWSEIKTWREWQRLLSMVNHVVVTRPGYDVEVHDEVSDRIVDLRSRELSSTDWTAPKIFFTDVVFEDVSATEIRELGRQKKFEELSRYVSRPVVQYIEKYSIY
jgi:nicotinate-nucleotide adenylyltransferase